MKLSGYKIFTIFASLFNNIDDNDSVKSISMNKKIPTLAIAVAAFCLASCYCDDDTPTTSKYIALVSGKYTTVNLIVGRNEITFGSVSINN